MPASSDILIAAAVGAGASLLANVIWSRMTAPKLAIADPRQTSVEGDAHFWGAPVEMAPPLLFPRHPALAVQANAEIRDPSSGKRLASFKCRWQGTPQPLVPQGANVCVPSIPAIPVGLRDDVFQHKPGAADLLVKFDGEDAFYGFPKEAYFHQLPHKDFRFDRLPLSEVPIGHLAAVRRRQRCRAGE